MRNRLSIGWLLASIACSGAEPTPTTSPEPEPTAPVSSDPYTPLEPAEHLVRISMSLRGLRPSVEDLQRVTADPEALPALVDAYLDEPEFLSTMRDLHAELFLLRRDTFELLPPMGLLDDVNRQDIYRAQVEEPLELVDYIIASDLPYTDIVTSDVMFTNDVLARMYGIPYDEQLGGWQRAWWSDGRPAAGLLSSAEMLRRWESNGSNFNRGRANMVADKLLCAGFDGRDITVEGGIDIADEFEVAQAVLVNDSCVACHQTLDPLGAYFWGYMRVVRADAVRMAHDAQCTTPQPSPYGPNHDLEHYCYPIAQYSADAEQDWEGWGLRPPSYFGHPAVDLEDVGRQIAGDPRFAQCAARNFYGYFAQIPQQAVPFDIAAELQNVLVESGFSARELTRAVMLHPSFGALTTSDDPSQPEQDSPVGLKTTRPEQYARAVEGLTGYRWWSLAERPSCVSETPLQGTNCWGDVDLSTSDLFGFRAMQGGVDSFVITHPLHTVTPTKMLTLQVLSHDAARFVVDSDFDAEPSDRRLLRELTDPGTDDPDAIVAQLVVLHQRILGVQTHDDDPDIALSYGLFAEVLELNGGDTRAAWTVTVATLLQDPRVLFY